MNVNTILETLHMLVPFNNVIKNCTHKSIGCSIANGLNCPENKPGKTIELF